MVGPVNVGRSSHKFQRHVLEERVLQWCRPNNERQQMKNFIMIASALMISAAAFADNHGAPGHGAAPAGQEMTAPAAPAAEHGMEKKEAKKMKKKEKKEKAANHG